MDISSLRACLCLDRHRVVFVRFTAKWCAPCKWLAPAMDAWEEHLGTEDSYVRFITSDVDDGDELYAYFKRMRQVAGLPTVLAFRAGAPRAAGDALVPEFHFAGASHAELDKFVEDTIRACLVSPA